MKLRMIAAVAATTLIATLGLTACSGQAASADCLKVASGSASDSVKVDGDFGGKSSITIDSPLTVESLQRTVVTKGDGAVPKTGQRVEAIVTLFSGTTGKPVDAVSTTLTANDKTLADPVRAGIDCLAIGTRSVAVFPGSDLYTEQMLQSVGLGPNEPVVVVIDLVSLNEDPSVTEWSTGVPAVTFDSTGKPAIDLSGATKPDGIGVAVLKEGTGETVDANHTVKINYYGVKWSDGTSFDGNYGTDPAEFTLTGVIVGFRVGLLGQKVGSQLLISIPAKDAYGEGTPSANNPMMGEDLLFLVDIVGVSTATK
ncbi:MAG: FKBP-type peptidyl-prolyl cis-trans isomerase [Agromyces sp.]